MGSGLKSGRRRISIFGSTGSGGGQTVEALNRLGGHESFEIVVLTGGRNVERLARQARVLRPQLVVTAFDECREDLETLLAGCPVTVASGGTALVEAADRKVDWAMSAIVGFAGLYPNLQLLRQSCTLALANKESLVAAGKLVTATASKSGSTLLPVDSEHSAIFQLLLNQPRNTIETITLTASGGPFKDASPEELARVTPEQAARHPTWNMGTRISIDSATLFNKALELIEAHELFGIPTEDLRVVVHPQSVIHAIVGFVDGQMLAHLSTTDMRGAIEYALHWPERLGPGLERLDLAALGALEFEAPDEDRFPALRLAREVLDLGGLAGAAFNGAKEAALDAFLADEIGFTCMSHAVEATMNSLAGNNELGGDPLDPAAIHAVDSLARARLGEQVAASG